MRRVLGLIGLLAASGCDASIKDGVNNNNGVDAGSGSSTGEDAGLVQSDAATADAAVVCTQARSVYLNFEGQTLTKATASDATTNKAAWLNKATGTAPAFRANSGNRAADITQITNGITAALAAIPVDVVTTRPTTGAYMMVVFGGTAAQIGSDFGGAVQKLDCGNLVTSDVAWVADGVTPNQRVINFALGAIGFGVGLTATTETGDCMCGWDNQCQQSTAQCTFSASIARDPAANQLCPNVTTQNEPQSLQQGFCQ